MAAWDTFKVSRITSDIGVPLYGRVSLASFWAKPIPPTFFKVSMTKSELGVPLYGSSFLSIWALEGAF
jgi:hypothetical protein